MLTLANIYIKAIPDQELFTCGLNNITNFHLKICKFVLWAEQR